MSKKTLALILGLIILAVILLSVALLPILSPTPKEPSGIVPSQPSITPTPPAHTTINLMPNPLTLTQTTGTVDIVIDTGENELTAIQLEIAYDPNVLANVTLTPSDFFPNPLTLVNTIDEDNGRITYALGITPAQTPVKGHGTVAKMTFQKLLNAPFGPTMIELLPKTLVTQSGVSPSVLKSATGTTVIIPTAQTISPQPVSSTPTVQPAQ